MQEEKTAENKANYIDGGNFKARIGMPKRTPAFSLYHGG